MMYILVSEFRTDIYPFSEQQDGGLCKTKIAVLAQASPVLTGLLEYPLDIARARAMLEALEYAVELITHMPQNDDVAIPTAPQDIRQAAIMWAEEMHIDGRARLVALYHPTATHNGQNHYYRDGLMTINATAGAGTNSCSIWIDGERIYHASDYGRLIGRVNPGDWIALLCQAHHEAEIARDAQQREARMRGNAEIQENFQAAPPVLQERLLEMV